MKLFSSFLALSIAENTRRPNVILLNCDDFGIGDFQVYNKDGKVPTPNIDRIGNEGVKFLDGHSGSSRCSPSRYMLMTGRYSMEDSPSRKIGLGEPQLGEMFKKSGYKTGIFGKFQPLVSQIKNLNATLEDERETRRLDKEFMEQMKEYGESWGNFRPANDLPGTYIQSISPLDHSYDYSFTQSSVCCQPGGFYENGKGIEPVDTWILQQPYPEENTKKTNYDANTGKCNEFPVSGYMGDIRQTDKFEGEFGELPLFHCNFPGQQLAMKSYDTRLFDELVIPKVEQFIDESHEQEFFIYYGMRSGHKPFNTPIRFRNQTEAGMLGEMIMEADEIVGRIFDRLETYDIADDTLVVFMSDNGADGTARKILEKYGHSQHRLDLPDRTIELSGAKNWNGEAGHRTPFLWRYPRRFAPSTIYDPKVAVSYVDVYATLADLIGYDLDCNEAPDSRSLVHYMETGEANEQLIHTPVLTHAKNGPVVSLRKKEFKYVPESKELYNMERDPEEKDNLYSKGGRENLIEYLDGYLNHYLGHIEKREAATAKGKVKDSCYPTFERFHQFNF